MHTNSKFERDANLVLYLGQLMWVSVPLILPNSENITYIVLLSGLYRFCYLALLRHAVCHCAVIPVAHLKATPTTGQQATVSKTKP